MSPTQTAAPVHLRGYTKTFGDNIVLQDVDLSIEAGSFVALVGKSGSGKSTLLRSIAGIDRDYDGSIDRSEKVAFGFQDARLLPWSKVWHNVVLGQPGSTAQLRAAAKEALAEVGLEGKADVWPATLSGGQQQRVSLARALHRQPELLLLDEPFGALDALTRLHAQALVHDLWVRHRFTVVLVTHDVEEAITLADRIVVLSSGGISLDVTVDLDRPRDRRLGRFEDLRERVLLQLGVSRNEI